MRLILQKRSLRFVFAANVISMLGSGMNSAAVAWTILQRTHSEMALGTLAVLQTIPAMLMLPFTGVIIDREDRRRLVMMLDAARALVIAVVMTLAFLGRVQVWQLYLMNTLVAAGFWMFWPTITALIQELTPEGEFMHSNTLLLAGVQGGWMIAGAVVGFVYEHIGLGGVLLIDVSTYVVSFLCYLAVRKGRHVVPRAGELKHDIEIAETQVGKFVREMRDGLVFLRDHRRVVFLGTSWALFLGAMMTGVVVTAPLSDRVFHAGATGYGWLNGGWGVGAFLSALYTPFLISRVGSRLSIALSMLLLTIAMALSPFSPWLALAVLLYGLMGSARGVSGVAMNTSLMEQVPAHLMGRVQNTFYFFGTMLQIILGLAVGAIASRVSLAAGFGVIAAVYAVAFGSACWPVKQYPVASGSSHRMIQVLGRSTLPFCAPMTRSSSWYALRFSIGAFSMFEDLKGKTAVVFGVANKRSIAWAIAQGLHAAGANLAITYQNERMEMEAKDLILSLPGAEAFMCDVSDDAEIASLFERLKQRYGKLHTIVHSVAYAPAEELKGDFVNTTREGFRIAHDVSAYSLIAVCRAAAPLMEDGGSVITMTYYGAEKVVPHYNVMGVAKAALECTVRYLAQDLGRKKIRVNAISAGPIKTLAARGISGLGDMLKSHAERAPLQRNVEVSEVGSTGVFLASDASSGITGEVIYVDCGYNIMGF